MAVFYHGSWVRTKRIAQQTDIHALPNSAIAKINVFLENPKYLQKSLASSQNMCYTAIIEINAQNSRRCIMENTNGFQDRIVDAARMDDDVRLAEAILEYFRAVENVAYLPLKRIKSFFVAARSEESETWIGMTKDEANATENVLTWTGHSANTIAVVLRTYERATEELKQAQREGRISRYPAESISRLYGKPVRHLQPRLVEMYVRNQMTHDTLRSMVRELQRTISRNEQETILARYAPDQPAEIPESRFANADHPPAPDDDQSVFILLEKSINDLRQYSDDELWRLKSETEAAIQHAIPLLERSLGQIKYELRRRL